MSESINEAPCHFDTSGMYAQTWCHTHGQEHDNADHVALVYGRGFKDGERSAIKRRDEALDRWRWPENPDVVVYRFGSAERRSVTVFFEATGGIVIGMSESFLSESPDDGHLSRAAARAYFAAHPLGRTLGQPDAAIRAAIETDRARIRSKIGGFVDEGVWAFDAAISTLEQSEGITG